MGRLSLTQTSRVMSHPYRPPISLYLSFLPSRVAYGICHMPYAMAMARAMAAELEADHSHPVPSTSKHHGPISVRSSLGNRDPKKIFFRGRPALITRTPCVLSPPQTSTGPPLGRAYWLRNVMPVVADRLPRPDVKGTRERRNSHSGRPVGNSRKSFAHCVGNDTKRHDTTRYEEQD